jgi:uncharacterized membrane protein YciS (DUF1049 family)
MDYKKLKNAHKWGGMCLAPFFILISISATVLLLNHAGIITLPGSTFQFFFTVHTWEFIGTITGIIFPLGLLYMSITGPWLYLLLELKKRKAKKASHQKEKQNTAT